MPSARNTSQRASACRESDRDKWSPRGFYKAMLWTFREPDKNGQRDDKTPAVTPPFYLHRPLKKDTRKNKYLKDEFHQAQQHYVLIQNRQHLKRTGFRFSDVHEKGHDEPIRQTPEPPSADRWPDLSRFTLSGRAYWEYERALGQLFFAQTARQQARARNKVKQLSSTGPMPLRPVLSRARRLTPQVKARHSGKQVLAMLRYRDERYFLWEFLRREALAGNELNPTELSKDATALNDGVTKLMTHYSHLVYRFSLTAAQMKRGICNPHKAANDDVAKKFHCSPTAVRPFFSKFYPPLKTI